MRSAVAKQRPPSRMAELLSESPGIRPEDVLVSLVEAEKANWSLGNGIAQYA
nr:tautomerase family protein [Pandoraea bronchicola]